MIPKTGYGHLCLREVSFVHFEKQMRANLKAKTNSVGRRNLAPLRPILDNKLILESHVILYVFWLA